MIEVEIGERDRLDSALGRLRRQLIRSGLFADMRRKRFYEKPSEARKSKGKAALRRRQRVRRMAQRGGRSWMPTSTRRLVRRCRTPITPPHRSAA